MKKLLQRALTLLLACAMTLTMIPLAAFAVGEPAMPSQIGQYVRVDKTTGTIVANSGQTSPTVTAENGAVEISKTITSTGVENKFQIELKVVTTEDVEALQLSPDAAVVLVLDTSKSMSQIDSGESMSRLARAKIAAKNFVDNYTTNAGTARRMLAVVSFSTDANCRVHWTDVNNTANATSVKASIGNLTSVVGTNIEGGLMLAKNLLGMDAVKDIKNVYVILLSDGTPTRRVATNVDRNSTESIAGDDYGNSNSQENRADYASHARIQADAIKRLGAKAFAVSYCAANDVCYWTGNGKVVTVGSFLADEICSENGYFSASSGAQLDLMFEQINAIIQQQIKPWTVTDPVQPSAKIVYDGFVGNPSTAVVNTSNILTWDLTSATPATHQVVNGNKTTTYYTYTVKYGVTLDTRAAGFVEGTYYPTNGFTKLDYTVSTKDAQNNVTTKDGTAEFLIPTVRGFLGDLAFTKTGAAGAPLAGAVFSLKQNGTQIATDTSDAVTGAVAFNNLSAGDYTVTETSAPQGYIKNAQVWYVHVAYGVTTVTKDGVPVTQMVWTNTPDYTLEVKDITVVKSWVHPTGTATAPITILLMRTTNPVVAPTQFASKLLPAGQLSVTFKDVRVYDDAGVPYFYTAVDQVNGYVCSTSDSSNGTADATLNIKNTIEQKLQDVCVQKIWNDQDNKYSTRPANITYTLTGTANGGTAYTASYTATSANWNHTFKDVPKYQITANGAWLIAYSVTENAVPNYKTSITGLTITNSLDYTAFTKDITVNKVWMDPDATTRPTPVTISLWQNGGTVAYRTATLTGTSVTFSDVPVFDANGTPYTYSVSDNVAGYGYAASGTSSGMADATITLTNTINQQKITVSGTKVWIDDNNAQNTRPGSITVSLLKNGTATGATQSLTTGTTFSFTDLDKFSFTYDANNKVTGVSLNRYTVVEQNVPGYTTTYSADTLTITNEVTATRSISATKVWVSTTPGVTHPPVTFRLLADGQPAGFKTLTTGTTETVSWDNLAMYKKGVLIRYRVVEDAVQGYSAATTGSMDTGFTITNTLTENYSVTVTKVWDDNSNSENTRPTGVEFKLYADTDGDGVLNEVAAHTMTSADASPTSADVWVYTFTGLAQFRYVEGTPLPPLNPGDPPIPVNTPVELTYSVDEPVVPNLYSKSINGFTITNKHSMDSYTVTVAATKVWVDGQNALSTRPAFITYVCTDNKGVAVEQTAAAPGWGATFTVPKYDTANGNALLTYTITEKAVPNYSTAVTGGMANGFVVTNTLNNTTTDVTIQKSWVGDTDVTGAVRPGYRPASISLTLTGSNGYSDTQTVAADANGNWAHTWPALPKYVITDASVTLITYTPSEDPITGYTTAINGYTVTNTLNQKFQTINFVKVWVDDNDAHDLRPTSIDVTLSNGTNTYPMTITPDATGAWTYSWTDLPVYSDAAGTLPLNYSLTEDTDTPWYSESAAVYDADTKTFTITNTLTQEYIDIPVGKQWVDEGPDYGSRPASITVRLLADTVEVDDQVITPDANGAWGYTFTDKPKYSDENKTEIIYTVKEDAVDGYDTAINGFTVVNTWRQELIDIPAQKVWLDGSNAFGYRSPTLTLRLIADGDTAKPAASFTFTGAIATAGDTWRHTFENMPRYSDLTTKAEIRYTILEDAVDSHYTAAYSTAQDGTLTVTNSCYVYAYRINRHYTNLETGMTANIPGTIVQTTKDYHLTINSASYATYGGQTYSFRSATPGLTGTISTPWTVYDFDLFYQYEPLPTTYTLSIFYYHATTGATVNPPYQVTLNAGVPYDVTSRLNLELPNLVYVMHTSPAPTAGFINSDLVFIVYYEDPYIPYTPPVPPVVIPETPVPLAPAPEEDTTVIVDDEVPLGALPTTGTTQTVMTAPVADLPLRRENKRRGTL